MMRLTKKEIQDNPGLARAVRSQQASGGTTIPNQEHFRIGVTGHRHLENKAALSKRITQVLADLEKEQGRKGNLMVLSSLAEGADRLVPQVALDLGHAGLQAVLPLAAADYCQDFSSDDSRAEFRALLRRAESSQVLEPRPSRPASYESVGHFIVDHSDVLLALWDGQPARGQGGTAEVVAYARRQGVPIYWIDTNDPTSWKRLGESPGGDQDEKAAGPNPGIAPETAELTALGSWGQDFQASRDHVQPPLDQESRDRLTARFATIAGHFAGAYDEAEDRALSLQGRYRQASLASYILATLAVLIVSAQSILHLNHWIILGEVVAIALILLVYHLGQHKEWHLHWMESRLEAEWIRNGIFVAFLRGRTIPGIDRHWSCKWVSNAESVKRVRQLWSDLPTLPELEESDLPLLRQYMKDVWITQQKQYHEDKSGHEKAKHNRISGAGEFMFWGTFLAAILHLLPHSFYHRWHLPDGPIIKTLTLLAIGLPTMGAALAGLRSHFEFNKIASRSAMMASHLGDLEKDLARVQSIDELGKIVEEAETLMLQENSDWYFTIGMHHIEKG